MTLTFTETAVKQLTKREAISHLSLYYDDGTDVCACANSGVFILRANDSTEPYDTTIDSNLGPINAQKSALVYLDQANIIDFKIESNALILKSERGFLNLNLRLEIKAKEAIQA